MTFQARFDDEASLDQRDAARRTLRLAVEGRFAAGASAVTVHNISATGLLIETAVALAEGDSFALDLPEAEGRTARVVWVSAPMFGCKFDAPLTPAALSAAQLRGEAGGDGPAGGTADFGAQLHRLRIERGLSLADIAGRLGVSKPTVWAWEHNKARPVERRLAALAAVLGVTPSGLEPVSRGPAESIEVSRRRIADSYGVEPAKVRIMIEL